MLKRHPQDINRVAKRGIEFHDLLIGDVIFFLQFIDNFSCTSRFSTTGLALDKGDDAVAARHFKLSQNAFL